MTEGKLTVDSEVALHQWVGARIRQIRVTKNMTQEELAQRMGTQRPAVSNWENGINMPSLFTLLKMAEIFEVSLRQLIESESEDPTDVPMIPLDTAVDKPGLERWIRLYERLTELGDAGQHLLQSTLRIFGRLGALGDSGSGQVVYLSVLHAIQQALNFGLTVLTRDDQRRTTLFLSEIGLALDVAYDQERFAHIHQVFVPPEGYVDLLARFSDDQRVAVITGAPHQGKTFVAMKLLADVAEKGYRPIAHMGCFTSMPGDTAKKQIRLDDCLRSGHALLLDNPFAANTGNLALREFAADPRRAFQKAEEAQCRLIVTVDEERLAERPGVSEFLQKYRWCVNDRYRPTSFVRMVINYSEIYHPNAREPIVASHEGLLNPHAVERTFAIATDNRQTIRRRSAGIRREGVEAVTVADFAALDNAELAFLLLCRHVPLPVDGLLSILSRLEVRRIGGDLATLDTLMENLRRWVLLRDGGEGLNAGFYHPSYASALDILVLDTEKVRVLGARILHALAFAGDPYLDRAAVGLLSVLSAAGAPSLRDVLREAGLKAGQALAKCDPAVAAFTRIMATDAAEPLAADLARSKDSSFTRRYLSALSLIARCGWSDADFQAKDADLWKKMVEGSVSEDWQTVRNLFSTAAGALGTGDARLSALAGTLLITPCARNDAQSSAKAVREPANSAHRGVARSVRRALLDCLDSIPAEAREDLIAAAGV